mgnify:CR=1 FL=1
MTDILDEVLNDQNEEKRLIFFENDKVNKIMGIANKKKNRFE